MKKWVEKLIQQFDFDWNGEKGVPVSDSGSPSSSHAIGEDRATVLFLIDTFNKHLLEFEGHPVRKTREILDDFAKELIRASDADGERILFRFRQFFATYRIDETAYFHKTFEDFRVIIWDFVDQLAEDMGQEQKDDEEIKGSLESLKEAVETNSIDVLKDRSRKFIDCYMEKQFKRDKRRNGRMKSIRKNLNTVKKQLSEANDSLRFDHLTQALNRKSFDECCLQQAKLLQVSEQPATLLMLDIDYFKRINDTHGHALGDFVLKELVKILKNIFTKDTPIARIGGEEFAVILPETEATEAMVLAEKVLQSVREETLVHDGHEIRFTVSIGVSQLTTGEGVEGWLKRADLALYNSKNTGRNRVTLAPAQTLRAA